VEQQDGQPVPRRLVGIDLGIASRAFGAGARDDGQVVCRAMRADGQVPGACRAGCAGRRAERHEAGGGVRVDQPGVDTDRGVLSPFAVDLPARKRRPSQKRSK
jgi:hypothetical protein